MLNTVFTSFDYMIVECNRYFAVWLL